ncbi:MAG: hypothetical protein CVU89_12605 [Firmicutes bacterium HGW-Firmicutes-14]|nr:MAG: hypothetical protein CVU89_12605 [Firmicutes bacterium HGW-Firmicutes-14]
MDKAKKLKITVIILGILVIAFTVAAVEYTSQTGFCNSCHEMNTAFAGWENNVHQEIHCYGCHTDKGLVEKVKTKAKGLKEVYIHFTREVDMDQVKSEVPDRRCIQCHDFSVKKKFENEFEKRIYNFHIQHKELNYGCLTCHGDAGHSRNTFIGFKNESCRTCHLPEKKG